MPDNPKQDPQVRAYVSLIRAAEALHAEVSRALLLEGLTASQFSTMKVLRLHGALAQRDIAKFLLKSGGNVTMVVDNLEREGLVSRTRDTEDRRIVYVKLTDAGAKLFDRIYPGHLERIRAAMGGISDAECESLVAVLDRLTLTDPKLICMPDSFTAQGIKGPAALRG